MKQNNIIKISNQFYKVAQKESEDISNDFPRSAINAYLSSQQKIVLDKWNNILDSVSDDVYNMVKDSVSLDLRIMAVLDGTRFSVSIKPEIEPSRNKEIEQILQRFMDSISAQASAVATKAYRPRNSTFGTFYPEYLKFV